jgi:hypothetical protein
MMGTLVIQPCAYLREGIVSDSILWGVQLIELDSTDLHATSEHGMKTPTFIGRYKNHAQTGFNAMTTSASVPQKRTTLNSV